MERTYKYKEETFEAFPVKAYPYEGAEPVDAILFMSRDTCYHDFVLYNWEFSWISDDNVFRKIMDYYQEDMGLPDGEVPEYGDYLERFGREVYR